MYQQNFKKLPAAQHSLTQRIINNQQGRIGYLVAWMLGVPASLLFVIFLIRG